MAATADHQHDRARTGVKQDSGGASSHTCCCNPSGGWFPKTARTVSSRTFAMS
jgi:hypothetical protein